LFLKCLIERKEALDEHGDSRSNDKGVQLKTSNISTHHQLLWGHLIPILQLAKDENASVENLYVLSDGPTTQYRCRENFFLLTKIPLKMVFKTVNWNFIETGHGKGAPDGIGAVIKRTADTFVLQGEDITNARDLFTTWSNKELAVKLFLIEDDAITALEECLKAKAVKSVKK